MTTVKGLPLWIWYYKLPIVFMLSKQRKVTNVSLANAKTLPSIRFQVAADRFSDQMKIIRVFNWPDE